jgi:hypothetical protein
MTALADQALADFAAREGIALPGAETPPAAPRTMGAATGTPPPAKPLTEDQGT